MLQHIAQWNPTTQLWETEQADLFSGQQEPFSETWPTSGMTRSGQLWPLPMSAHRIGGNEYSSLLPTPVVMDSVGARNSTAWRSNSNHNINIGDTLTDVFWKMAQERGEMLPTPRATDGTKGGPNQRGSSGDLMLPSALHLLPTPTCNDAKNSAGPSQVQRNTPALAMVTHLLPTPSVADGMGGHLSRSGDRSHELLLPGIVKTLLPTPAVNDMGAGKTVEAWDSWTTTMQAKHGNGNDHGKSLHIEAARISASTPPPFAAGNQSSDDPHPTPPNQAATDPDYLPGLSSGSWGSRTVG